MKESCDLGPFLTSMSSISKIRVLLGGILPTNKPKVWEVSCSKTWEDGVWCFYGVTFSFFSIRQYWRNCQFPALSCAHVLQTLIPTLHRLLDPKSEPYWIFISIFAAASGCYNNALQLHSEDWKQQLHPQIWKFHITWNEIACHYSLGIHRNVQGACLHILTYDNKRVVYVELQSLPPAQAIFSQRQIQRLRIISNKQTKESFWFVCKKI